MRIEASDNCDFFTYVQESDIPADNIINFTTPIQASNVKIIILAADPANADSKPMALNRFNCILQRGFLKMAPDLLSKISSDVLVAMQSPQVKKQFAEQGADAGSMNQAQYAKYVDDEINKWAKVITDSNIKID